MSDPNSLLQAHGKNTGEPTVNLQGSAGGNNAKNFSGGFNAGVATKVWESNDKSLVAGVSYGQGIARVNGQTFHSKPNYGAAVGFQWRF